ncbi:ROK family protein [Actinomyces bowdenii]|uniref:ROK family protein n=1 Tax=Actinomyces bowdenii TaxID=131109 RepID=A0A3P1V8A2_9ACTO|nr:ROK family protein [Actinomyces bowdenii]RRD29730.1 ROK family protein [Actinomyces bowdenii]
MTTAAPTPERPRGQERGLVVGLDLGGTKMAASLVSAAGEQVGRTRTRPTPAHEGPGAMLEAIASLVRDTVRGSADGGPVAAVAGVGIGTAGVVDVEAGRIVSSTDAITGWAGTEVAAGVAALLEPELGALPIHVENDVDAYAAGEAWMGAGRGLPCVLVAAVGTGVGGALVLSGSARRGAHHVAGEIGHIPVAEAAGERCTCGRPGHLEAVAAGPQIHRRYLALGGDRQARDAREVEERADAGDALARRVYQDSATALGRALAGAATLVDPDLIIISGGLARSGQLWWGPLRRAFAGEVIGPLADLRIVPAVLGTSAPIIGAARGALRLAGIAQDGGPAQAR